MRMLLRSVPRSLIEPRFVRQPTLILARSINQENLKSGADAETSSKNDGLLAKVLNYTNTRSMMIGGGSLVALGITYSFYDITYAFMSLTPAASLYYGFVSGVFTAGTAGGMAWYAERSFHISPDRAVVKAVHSINKNPVIVNALGKVKAGTVKSYTSKHGGFSIKATNASMFWDSPQIQIMFPVTGSKNNQQAMACVVYGKKGFSEILEYVGIDLDPSDPTASMFVVEGNSAKFNIQNNLKAHVKDISRKF